MGRQRTSSIPELLLTVDRDGPVALHRQLERGLQDAIRQGRLQPGAALPSTRALAEELGLSRGVVVEAYEQLTAEGYLDSTPGGKTRVAERAAADRSGLRGKPSIPAPSDADLGPASEPTEEQVVPPFAFSRARHDFSYGRPDVTESEVAPRWTRGETGEPEGEGGVGASGGGPESTETPTEGETTEQTEQPPAAAEQAPEQ